MIHIETPSMEIILAWHGFKKGYRDQAGHPWTINEDTSLARSVNYGGPFPYKVEALETEAKAKTVK